jgi:hypothetical protein
VTVRWSLRLLSAAPLGVLTAVLVSCGSSGTGLIPAADAGPLLRDFQAVEAAAKVGNGNCTSTEAALATTESGYHALPSSVDAGLRARLEEGISHLHERALALCAQPLAQTTTGESTSTTKAAAPPTATTEAQTTTGEQTSTTGTGASTTPSATTPSGTEGGTAPGVGTGEGQAGESGAGGSGQGSADSGEGAKNGGGPSGGTGSGGTGSGGSGSGGSGSGGSGQ